MTRAKQSATERHAQLLRILRSDGSASVPDLAKLLGVAPATIRRDLQQLSVDGQVLRTYGGAAVAGPVAVRSAAPSEAEAKRLIAAAATELVHDGQTIVITSGTTTLEFARRLVGWRRITAVTNALDVAQILTDRDGIDVVVLGGVLRPRIHSLLGHLTEMAAREIRADTLFMGIPAIDLEHGLMSDYLPEVLTDRALREMARRVVVLADGSKFQKLAPALVFGLDHVHTLVTDESIAPPVHNELVARGIDVIVAGRHDGSASERAVAPRRLPGPRDSNRSPDPRDSA